MKNHLLTFLVAILSVSLCAIFVLSLQYAIKYQKIQTDLKSHVNRVAEYLDSQTTETGAYIKSSPREVDATGRELLINYSRFGNLESFEVRACGLDQLFYTEDDVEEMRFSVVRDEDLPFIENKLPVVKTIENIIDEFKKEEK